MLFTCPACKQRTILFPTVLLHVWGKWPSSAANRFECTHCHTELACYYSPIPFLLLGAILQIFLLQSGSLQDLWMGALITAGLALFVFPVKDAGQDGSVSAVPVRRFNTPWDQGVHYIETRLLSQGVFVLVTGLTLKWMLQSVPAAGAHAGGLIYLLIAAVVGLVVAMIYGLSIYRLGRHSTPLRAGIDVAVVIALVLMIHTWR